MACHFYEVDLKQSSVGVNIALGLFSMAFLVGTIAFLLWCFKRQRGDYSPNERVCDKEEYEYSVIHEVNK